jgi:hypothetical protein
VSCESEDINLDQLEVYINEIQLESGSLVEVSEYRSYLLELRYLGAAEIVTIDSFPLDGEFEINGHKIVLQITSDIPSE